MNKPLSQYFSVNRRYSRSINLERDVERLDALVGYIPTERSVEALKQILSGLQQEQSNRAWTLTSVYGTGKSAFAHFLACLCAPAKDTLRQQAILIAEKTLSAQGSEYRSLQENIPNSGLFRAVATAQREPISHTIVRALARGARLFWSSSSRGKEKAITSKLVDLEVEITAGRRVDSREIPNLVQEVAQTAQTGVLLIIDELGKNLEFAVYNEGAEDLYLLQQLAELPQNSRTPVYLLGLLHQAFADYGQRLASVQRNEWAKIQGRFEDIPFTDSAGQMMRLIGQVIAQSGAEPFKCAIHKQALYWFERLEGITKGEELTPAVLGAVYPLHPITALVLPMLCTRYAQNDRSLFTFLTSSEPYAFNNFLDETTVEEDSLPTLKLDQVYDYFLEAVGMGLASRPNLSRWVEIQGLIADAKHLETDTLKVLKTIGILNLVTTTGAVRATRELVTLAMCDFPTAIDVTEGSFVASNPEYWEDIIDRLLKRNVITHRRLLDELRIWEGSDFNIEGEIAALIEQERSPITSILSTISPLKPLVAQRHTHKTGTLRYFEPRYIDAAVDLSQLRCTKDDCDGLIGYWLDEADLSFVAPTTADGKPLIILCATQLSVLRIRALELAALQKIHTSAPQLQTDGVARREVQYRLVHAKRLLDESLAQAFSLMVNQNPCWIMGERETISHITDLNTKLSEVCDKVYPDSLKLRNELINRRELTNQGAKARRELIEAMLERPNQERLGLQGYGPEVSMYYSLLGETGIHRHEDGEWGFYPPQEKSGVWTVWQAIEEFCVKAKEKQQTLDNLYKRLEAPPYGVKRGAIPVLVAAIFLHHVDDVGVYKDGTFIPVLGAEHFELLVKDPARFGVKYFEVAGLRSQVFRELEAILRKPNSQMPPGVRNATLLAVAKPLFQFVRKLPAYTIKTKRLSAEAIAVLQKLQQAQEPDELLFTSLPIACGLPPIGTSEADDGTIAKTLRKKLVAALHEIQTAYERLVSDCQTLLYNAFGVRGSEIKLREDLRVRASYLVDQCIEPTLRRFMLAATDDTAADQEWLEALLMIVADKPAESWTDEDVTGFEIKLSNIARRFKNLESLQKEVAAKGEGFEARRITVTRPDGKETHRMVWIDHECQAQIERLVEKVLEDPILRDNPQLQHAFAAKLTEKVLGTASQENVAQIQAKRQNREDEQKTSHA